MIDILSFVDVGLVVGFIVFLESIKKGIKSLWNITAPVEIWKLAALLGGLFLAVVKMGIDEQLEMFNVWEFIKQGFLYSGASTIVYQTSKMVVKGLVNEKNS